jgi:glycosyltransferase involved in cell wall biosynthesis
MGHMMRPQKRDQKTPHTGVVMHFDQTFSNYLCGWILIDDDDTEGLEITYFVDEAVSLPVSVNALRSDIPKIDGKTYRAISIMDVKQRLGKKRVLEFKIASAKGTQETYSQNLVSNLEKISAISSIEYERNREISGWVAFIDEKSYSEHYFLRCDSGLIPIHLENRRVDVSASTGLYHSYSWVAYGEGVVFENLLDGDGKSLTFNVGGKLFSSFDTDQSKSEQGKLSFKGSADHNVYAAAESLSEFRIDSNLEFILLRDQNFDIARTTNLRLRSLLISKNDESKNVFGESKELNQETLSQILTQGIVPKIISINELQLRVVATWESGTGIPFELTELQMTDVKNKSIDVFSNENNYVDYLTSFAVNCRSVIGGVGLLTKNQVAFLNTFEDSEYQYTHRFNRFLNSRYRSIGFLNQAIPIDSEKGRSAVFATLFLDEIFNGYGETFFSTIDEPVNHSDVSLRKKLAGFCFLAAKVSDRITGQEYLEHVAEFIHEDFDEWYELLPEQHILKQSQKHYKKRNSHVVREPGVAESNFDRFLVVGMINHGSGLGRWADSSLQVLRSMDADVNSELLPVYSKYFEREVQNKEFASDVNMFVHLQPDYFRKFVESVPGLNEKRRIIACFAWETQRIPNSWIRSLNQADEIWTCSSFSADAFKTVFDKPVKIAYPLLVASLNANVHTRESLRIDKNDFVYYFSFDAHSSVYRKNPLDILRAFDKVRQQHDNVVLLLKIRNYQWIKESVKTGNVDSLNLLKELERCQNVKVITEDLSENECSDLLELCDAYISLHRSEGFGYTMAEAMMKGKPTIATGFSSNLEFMNEDNSWLVDFDVVSIDFERYPYCVDGDFWAQPNIDSAVERMLEVIGGGQMVRDKASLGQQLVSQKFGIESIQSIYASNIGR